MAKNKIKPTPIVSTPITRKEYSYQLDIVKLNFTLRQDITKELLHFRELLNLALVDVDKDIANFRKK